MNENGGVIVNIIADMWKGFPGMSHTGAARAGVDNLSKSLAMEWVSYGVRVNCIAPGIIYSQTAEANYGASSFVFTGQAKSIPAKRLGTVDEVTEIRYLRNRIDELKIPPPPPYDKCQCIKLIHLIPGCRWCAISIKSCCCIHHWGDNSD